MAGTHATTLIGREATYPFLLDRSLLEDEPSKTENRKSVATLSSIPSIQRDSQHPSPSQMAYGLPPAPTTKCHSLAEVEHSLNHVIGQTLGNGSHRAQAASPLSPVGFETKVSMDNLQAALTACMLKLIAQTADLKGDLLKRLTEVRKDLRTDELKKMLEQANKARENAEKAKKAGIFSGLVNAFIAAVEVVSGALKFLGGLASANPLMIAGGAAEFLAGTAGLLKVVLDAVGCDKAASIVGKVQMGLETVAILLTVVSVASVARLAGKTAGTVAEKVMGEVAGTALKDAAQSGAKESIKAASEQVAKEVIKELGENFATQIAQKAAGKASGKLAESINKQLTEKLIAQAIEKSVTKLAEQGATNLAQEVTKIVTKQVKNKVMGVTLKAMFHAMSSLTATNLARTVASVTVNGVIIPAITLTRANLQEAIKKLLAEQQFLSTLSEWHQETQKETQGALQQLSADMAKVVKGRSDSVQGQINLATVIAQGV